MTRSTTDLWLIGQQIDTLNQSVLPSNKEVLSLFMNYRNSKSETVRKALTSTVDDVMNVWQKKQYQQCRNVML